MLLLQNIAKASIYQERIESTKLNLKILLPLLTWKMAV